MEDGINMHRPGQRILKAIGVLRERGIKVAEQKTARGTSYAFGSDHYRITINIEPNWLGLEFYLLGTKIIYPINTDLYDINSPENRDFVQGIETDIISLLESLSLGKIKISQKGVNSRVLIPLTNKAILLKAGRFLSSAKIYEDTAKAKLKLGSSFQTLEM